MLLNAVLEWLHILGAIGWMGLAMLFGIVIGPTIARLSPPARGELIVKLFPRFLHYAEAFAYFTVIVGVLLAVATANGDLSIYAPTNTFGLLISAGAGTALVTVAVASAWVVPSGRKVLRLTKEMAEKPGPPPAELIKASERMKSGATVGLILQFVVLVLMVAASNV